MSSCLDSSKSNIPRSTPRCQSRSGSCRRGAKQQQRSELTGQRKGLQPRSSRSKVAGETGPDNDSPNSYLHIKFDAPEEVWIDWYKSAFRAIQQSLCRLVAKEWIKYIHPKKQSTHPYNGKVAGRSVNGDSESTKPPYWPKDVRHKEPDHISKDGEFPILQQRDRLTNMQHQSVSGS